MMDRETFPVPEFSRDELVWLQGTLDQLRAITFNELMEAKHRELPTDKLQHEYDMAKALRTKIYHLSGRDTLALNGYHEVRWWDQQHDY